MAAEVGSSEAQQAALERAVAGIYGELCGADERQLVLLRAAHVQYLLGGLRHLSAGHCALDASRPWLVFWITHSLALLEVPLPAGYAADAVAFLARCRAPAGGFGGGPGQQPHLATTYAACAALCTLGGPAAVAALDPPSLLRFLLRLKLPAEQGGGFCMTEGGEADTRGCYTALASARLAGVLSPALTDGVGDYLARCQTYEGGLGGEPHTEAHGGYTFCGLAAALLAGQAQRLHLPRLLHWAAHRQGGPEGGFNGRTNKLVDGCYSLWQGGLFPLLHATLPLLRAQLRPAGALAGAAPQMADVPLLPPPPPPQPVHAAALFASPADVAGAADESRVPPLYNARALQGWLLACCQVVDGGLRDKPGKPRDFYHTCYCLSGLSSAQHYGACGVVGPPANVLTRADPVLNVVVARLDAWLPLLPGGASC